MFPGFSNSLPKEVTNDHYIPVKNGIKNVHSLMLPLNPFKGLGLSSQMFFESITGSKWIWLEFPQVLTPTPPLLSQPLSTSALKEACSASFLKEPW